MSVSATVFRNEIEKLLVPNKYRLNALITLLAYYNIEYTIESTLETHNIIVRLGDRQSNQTATVIGAHYDIFPNSTGINDNTCALVVLINFLKLADKVKFNMPIDIVFFDREETGMLGSSEYLRIHSNDINSAYIFDIIGFGDTLIYGSHSLYWPNMESFGIKKVITVLPSDNVVFESWDIPAVLITAAHKDDMRYSYMSGYRVDHTAKFYESFHGRKLDNDIEIINFDLLNQALDFLTSTFLDN